MGEDHAVRGDDASLLEQLAEFSQSAGEYGSAMEYYEQLLTIARRARESSDLLSDIFFKIAACHVQMGEHRRALEFFEKAERHLPEGADALSRARIANERAFALMNLGEYEEADACVQQVTDAILDPSTAAELARAQKVYGVIAMRRGDWQAAAQALEAALAGFRMIDDQAGMAQCLNNLGLMEKNLGNFDRAIEHLAAAVTHLESVGNTVEIGSSLFNLGVAEFKSGNWEQARSRFEHALRLLEGVGNRSAVAKLCLNLGNYYRHKRDWKQAESHYRRAEAVVRELGEPREAVLVQEFTGDLAFSCEAYDEARLRYLEALAGGRDLAPRGDLVLEIVRRLSDLESVTGNLDQARGYVEEGLALSESLKEVYERGFLLRIRARIEATEGDTAAAADSYREALATHEECGTPFDLAFTRLEYVGFCIENIVDLEDATAHLDKARDTFERIGADYEAGHAYLLAAKLEMVCDHPGGDARHHLETAIDLLERVGAHDQEALRDIHRDIDRLLEEAAASSRNDLAALNGAVGRLQAVTDPEGRVQAIESVVEERMNADRVALFLIENGGDWALAPGSALPPDGAEAVLDVIRALQGERGFGTGPMVSTSPVRDPRLCELAGGLHEDRGSVAFMPLFSEEELIGGLYADVRADVGYFRQPQLDFLVALAPAATIAVQEMRLESVRLENRELRRRLASRSGFEGLITQNRRMLEILDVVERVRDSNTTVLLEGETGTGKELLARAIHRVSSRSGSELVTVNCAAISGDLLESELFGHLRGSFTDAKRDKTGLFERADGGTIFLDEIDKTSTAFQERLLRVVDQGEIKPVGSSQVRKIDVRIVCATNRPLMELVEKGQFLQDLYYRLRVIRIAIPPLRERKEDVPLLVEHFLERFNAKAGKSVTGFTHEAMNRMVAYPWPGNVRDLRHEVERAVVMAKSEDRIRLEDLSSEVRGGSEEPKIALAPDQTLQDCIERIERELVRKALVKTGGNRSHAAKELGLSRRGLLNKIARYGIDL